MTAAAIPVKKALYLLVIFAFAADAAGDDFARRQVKEATEDSRPFMSHRKYDSEAGESSNNHKRLGSSRVSQFGRNGLRNLASSFSFSMMLGKEIQELREAYP